MSSVRWAFDPLDKAIEKLKDLEALKAFKKTVESDGGRGTFNALFNDSAKDGGAAGGGAAIVFDRTVKVVTERMKLLQDVPK